MIAVPIAVLLGMLVGRLFNRARGMTLKNAAADLHRNAANQAIDEWNQFVSDNNLN